MYVFNFVSRVLNLWRLVVFLDFQSNVLISYSASIWLTEK